ncbi:Laccase-2 [Drechslerella dactyloides]|uniref:Laccase-2 n=1 Tax=Drechslerella dactyloides TaxID=74499 RepID=A0AAD6J045_DREDA|nr:Laccase-2 [Drechslerella dactyloides]
MYLMLLHNALWGLIAAAITVSAAPSEISEGSSLHPDRLLVFPRQGGDRDLLRGGIDPNPVVCGCDNRKDRRKWTSWKYDINTDYEDLSKIPNTGVVRRYELVLSNKVIVQDGYATSKMVVNGQYPGPKIEGCWGDIFEITVINRLNNHNGTAIHWHGVQQIGTNHMDGAAGVGQCPIPPGGSMTYRWRANQYGTTWYHSHFALQYTDGIVGPIVIHGPTSANYDEEYTLMLTDWYHKDAFGLFWSEVFGRPPAPDSKLLNGRWMFPCDRNTDPDCHPEEGGRHQITFVKGKKYKLRIVNMSTATQMSFWLQGHDFTVVQTDFVPVEPFQAKSVNIAIAQRYDIIVEAKADTTNQTDFWINMQPCGRACAADAGTGIIRYKSSSKKDPLPNTDCVPAQVACGDPAKEKLSPIVKRTVPAPPHDLLKELYPSFNSWPNLTVPFGQSVGHKWSLGTETFYINWTEPTLSYLGVEELSSRSRRPPKPKPLPSSYQPITLEKPGQWVYLVIVANFAQTDPAKLPIPVDHPIHLHGHDFVVLAQVTGAQWDPNNPPAFDLENPARRDTATLPGSGFLVIGFEAKNPGAWLVHCHIAFHASAGLVMQVLELPDQILPTLQRNDRGYVDKYKKQCKDWRQSWQSNPAKDDSLHESGA